MHSEAEEAIVIYDPQIAHVAGAQRAVHAARQASPAARIGKARVTEMSADLEARRPAGFAETITPRRLALRLRLPFTYGLDCLQRFEKPDPGDLADLKKKVTAIRGAVWTLRDFSEDNRFGPFDGQIHDGHKVIERAIDAYERDIQALESDRRKDPGLTYLVRLLHLCLRELTGKSLRSVDRVTGVEDDFLPLLLLELTSVIVDGERNDTEIMTAIRNVIREPYGPTR